MPKPSEIFFKGFGDESSLYKPIKNNVNFFRQEAESCTGDKMQVLKDDCRLFSQLFISRQSRESNLKEFFKHKNQSFPAALTDNGKLHTGQKSKLVNILETVVSPPDTEPKCDAIIIDRSSLGYSLSPKATKTFEDYAVQDVVPKIQAYSSKYQRTDIVFDNYSNLSLKSET